MKTCPQCSLRYPDETTFCFIDGATLQSAGAGPVGRTVGGLYLIERLVATGPWSAAYQARFRLAEAVCAVKLLGEPMSPEQAAGYLSAVKQARRYDHPHVAAPWTAGVASDGTVYVVRALLDAEPLGAQLARGAMRCDRALAVAAQILRGLGRIHDFGGAHGDLRPSNVLGARDGRIWLVDAGYGRSVHRPLWDPGADVADTIAFLAPELVPGGARQAESDPSGNAASASADLYALGALVYRMLAGRPHVEASSTDELRAKLRERALVAPSESLSGLPEGLGRWIDELLDRSPATRPHNAHQALLELEEIAHSAGFALPEPVVPDERGALATATTLASLFARWERYSAIFKRMMELGFPGGPAGQAKLSFDLIRGKAQDLQTLGQQAREQHAALDAVFRRAREGRQRIAEQMAAHIEQIRSAGAEARPLEREVAQHEAALAAFPQRIAERHCELIRWEGRSGFREPSQELAQAYRDLAELLDQWWSARAEHASALARVTEQAAGLTRVHAELAELRTALRIHESNADAEIEAYERALAELTARLDELEPDLLDQATRFTAPLRSKPELGGCFRELQQVAQ